MEVQVTTVAKPALFHLGQIRQLIPHLWSQALGTVTHVMVTPRSVYCSLLYVDLPLKLQLVQKAVPHLLTMLPVWACIHPVLCHLHWLTTEYQINFMVLVLTFKGLHGL